MINLLRSFARADGGAPAVEFAFVAPVMIVTFLGVAEAANYINAARKVSNIASSAADLVAQTTTINDDQMDDVMGALEVMLRPFDPGTAKIRISSVVADDEGETTIAWSDAQNWDPRPEGQPITLDQDIVPENQGIVMAEVEFSYHGLTFDDTFYLKPRRSTTVTRE
jgi:Flp pilus assembly protein TadG